jgi:hypothetical protein
MIYKCVERARHLILLPWLHAPSAKRSALPGNRYTISTVYPTPKQRALKDPHQFDELKDSALSDEKERSGQDGLEQLGTNTGI